MRYGARWGWVFVMFFAMAGATPAHACKVGEDAIIPSRAEVLARDRNAAHLVVVGTPTPLSEVTEGDGHWRAASATRYRLAIDFVEKGKPLKQLDVDEMVFSSCDLPFGKRHLAVAGKQRLYLRREEGKWLIVNSEALIDQPSGYEAADYDLQTRPSHEEVSP